MAKCPLCSRRPAKRRCPAKRTGICPACCATKREVEIDCPSDCVYLREGQNYAAETARDASPRPSREFSQQFRRRNAEFITAFAEAIADHRRTDPGLLDQDVRDAFAALKSTVRTLDSGIYYETLPEGADARSLYRRIRSLLDQLIQPRSEGHPALRISDSPDVVDFLIVSVEIHSGGRPKSRRFLDWLSSILSDTGPDRRGSAPGGKGSGLIVP
jgi:hypothetical protein